MTTSCMVRILSSQNLHIFVLCKKVDDTIQCTVTTVFIQYFLSSVYLFLCCKNMDDSEKSQSMFHLQARIEEHLVSTFPNLLIFLKFSPTFPPSFQLIFLHFFLYKI